MKFRVHASIIQKLGNELIGNDVTAISELIKNSYDADASYCKLVIDTKKRNESLNTYGSILIEDDGIGMDHETIDNGWLVISDSMKKKAKNDHKRTEKGRWLIGEKGIGRLATQKLGRYLTIITKKKEMSYEIQMTIDWDSFNVDETLDSIEIDLRRIERTPGKSYCKLEILGLYSNIWNSDEKVNEIRDSLSQIVSPFSSNDFNLIAKIDDKKIELNNYEDTISKYRDFTCSAKMNSKEIIIESRFNASYFSNKRQDYIPVKHDIIVDFARKRLNENEYSIDDNTIIFRKQISLLKKNIGEGLFKSSFDIGEIKLYIDTFNISYLKKNYNNDLNLVKNYIDLNYGIKVVRNGFLVYPYGFGGIGDWLELNKKITKSGSYYMLNNSNLIGYIELDPEKSSQLMETTNREGFVHDEIYSNFYEIVQKAINEINISRNYLSRLFLDYLQDENKKDDYSTMMDKNKEFVRQMTKDVKESNDLSFEDKFNDYQNKLVQTFEQAKNEHEAEIEKLTENMNQLIELASLGLSSEILSHEILKQLSIIDNLLDSVKTDLSINSLSAKTSIDACQKVIQSLKNQTSQMLPGVQVYRNKKENISIDKLLDIYETRIKPISNEKNISINIISGSINEYSLNIGKMLQVLDNLFDNSTYWLNYSYSNGLIDKKEIYIEFKDDELIYWDNGIGISVNDEKIIFEPFVSKKIIAGEPGRGLGLYICQSVLGLQKSRLRLIKEKNKFGNYYKFAIDFSRIG